MAKNILLSKEEVKLLHESLWHLYLEYDRESQAIHVNSLPELKKIFKSKRNQAKTLLDRLQSIDNRLTIER